VNDKRYTVVTSTNHMDRHRLGKIARGTFKQPCMIQHTDTDTTGFPADHEDTRACWLPYETLGFRRRLSPRSA
jgi:hypothetical protein